MCDQYLAPVELIDEERRSYRLHIYIAMLAFLLMFPVADSESYYMLPPKLPALASIPVKEEIPPLTIENVEKEILRCQILCRHQVLAQIKLESGNLESFLTRRTNNMLGMRYPHKRSTLAVGIYLPKQDSIVYGTQEELKKYRKVLTYAVYANWMDAIRDYKLWQEQTFNLEKRYMDFLKKNYAEDTLYINKIRHLAEKNKKAAAEI